MNKYLLPIFFLASCAQKPDVTVRSRLYQPNVLILAPNTQVNTIDGQYISGPTKEVWHSSQTVEKLEKTISQF